MIDVRMYVMKYHSFEVAVESEYGMDSRFGFGGYRRGIRMLLISF